MRARVTVLLYKMVYINTKQNQLQQTKKKFMCSLSSIDLWRGAMEKNIVAVPQHEYCRPIFPSLHV